VNCVLYVRISDPRKGQTTENQLLQLQTFVDSKPGWKVVEIYQDTETGSGKRVRPAYERLYEDAQRPKRKWEVIVFWSLDRFSREGTYETIHRLRQFQDLGVPFVSYREQYLDTLGPFREAVMGILAAVANMEHLRISDRVKAGMERGKLEGKRYGRKPAEVDLDKLRKFKEKNYSLAMMAHALGISRTTALRRLRQL
jgi:DNA invertase Pin-like site-specific DNA recombinase